jgi:anti-sigma B factor antagonist
MLPRIHPANSVHPNPRASLTTLRHDRSRALLRAVGEWDLANAHLLAKELDEHHRAGRRLVRLDLSAVSFLDCTCLDVLVTAHRRQLAARGTLVLTGLTPRLTRLLTLARLDKMLLTTNLSDLDTRPEHRTRHTAVHPTRLKQQHTLDQRPPADSFHRRPVGVRGRVIAGLAST